MPIPRVDGAAIHPDGKVFRTHGNKFYAFNRTTDTFIKRQLALIKGEMDKMTKEPVDDDDILFAKKRWENEAEALQLLGSRTTLPVPKLIAWGTDSAGQHFIETEIVHGVIQLNYAGDKCPMAKLHEPKKLTPKGLCARCVKLAQDNFGRFVKERLLPELRGLISDTTGLNGVVLPPTWIVNGLRKWFWQPKTVDTVEFVMIHGDLGPQNVLIDEKILEVKSIIDWEFSGYFPQDFQIWSVTKPEYLAWFGDKNKDMASKMAAITKP